MIIFIQNRFRTIKKAFCFHNQILCSMKTLVDPDVDPSQEDEEITVDVNSVVEVIGEKKRRPSMLL